MKAVPAPRWKLPTAATDPNGQDTSLTRRWLISVAALLMILGLSVLAYPNDLLLSKWICAAAELPGDLRRVLALSELMAHGSGVVILLLVVWRLAPHLRFFLPRVACCALMAGLVANALKLLHARFRPLTCPPDIETVERTWRGWFPTSMETLSQPYGYAYQSFPSAHTATAVGFAIGLAWLFPRGRKLFFLIAVLAGLQRIAFLAHWPSDVLVGAAVGVILGLCFTLPGTLGNELFGRFERYWMFAINTPIELTVGGGDNPETSEPYRRAA